MANIKVLQVNLGRGRTAHDMVYTTAREKDIDIVLISEPNIKISLSQNYILDNKQNVAMYIRNKNVGIHGFSVGDGYICLRWEKWCMYACYCSPNIPIEDFKTYIDDLANSVRETGLEAVIAGDFNSKSPMWGSPTTDARGEYLMEWAAEVGLNSLNMGGTPTFVRGKTESFIDITWATEGMTNRVQKWMVLDEGEIFTFHNYIYFEILRCDGCREKSNSIRRFLDKALFIRKVKDSFVPGGPSISPDDFIARIVNINRESTISVAEKYRSVPYWWNGEIEAKRKECHRLRRMLTRANKHLDNESVGPGAKLAYVRAKLGLKHMIMNAKRTKWNELINDLDSDVWGNGYKIAVHRLGKLSPPFFPDVRQQLYIIKELFQIVKDDTPRFTKVAEQVPVFVTEEMKMAVAGMKMGKAPGPDHITAEAVAVLADTIPDVLLDIFNQLLRSQLFPKCWKEARVVLLWKGKGKPMDMASSYRPISLLSAIGKLYERMIKERIELEVAKSGGLSSRQFGFVKGKSTTHAIRAVVNKIKESEMRWAVTVALDIKNAFNSAPWDKIVDALERRRIPLYLTNVIREYLGERKIVLGKSKLDMGAGVPQGSVLGPTLWNILYDGVLDLDLIDGVTSFAYADDLLIVVEAEDRRDLMYKTNETLEVVVAWMREHGLEVAPNKTEAAILRGPRKRDDIRFNIMGKSVAPKKELRYLGVVLSDKLNFGPHIRSVVEKAESSLASLSRIMPNVGGPSSRRREILYGVVQSQMVYACPAWACALEVAKYRNLLEGLQRRALLRVASGYRTISTAGIQVITGVPPVTLLIDEHCDLFHRRQMQQSPDKRVARAFTLAKWQEIWKSEEKTAGWTRILIPDIAQWVECKHRVADYYMTQFLSGHGHFRTFTKRFKLTQEDLCLYCNAVDTPEHAILICGRWEADRNRLITDIGQDICSSNVINIMIRSVRNWGKVASFIKKILKDRERLERELKCQGVNESVITD